MIDQYIDTIQNCDCLEFMKKLPNNCVDLVLTDPPYNASNKPISFNDKGYNAINEDWDKDFTIEFIDEAWRIVKDSVIAFCSHHTLGQYLSWKRPRQLLHWVKTNPFPAIAKVYTPNVEYMVWYTKRSPYTFNKKLANHTIYYSAICGGYERTTHPTQKPLSIMSGLLSIHSNEGDIIFDPFMGSGTTAVACYRTRRHYIGCEISKEYCEIAEKRIQDEKDKLGLFGGE